jgi:transposase-like protein
MKLRLRKKKPEVQAKLWQHDPEVFEGAMEMYWNGLGGAAIARHFNISDGTVYSWIHDFGSQRKRIDPVNKPVICNSVQKPLKERFRTAESADEWLETLRENALHEGESFEDMTVTLVCGTLHGQSANKLASVIYESLKEDPQSGRGYAFCNKGRNSIAVLSWNAPVYRISKYVRVHGTFIWPHEELGKSIEITKTEFDRLLLLEKHRKRFGKFPQTITQTTSINLEFMRVSWYT